MTYFDREKVSGNAARSRVSAPSEDVNELCAIGRYKYKFSEGLKNGNV